MSREETLRDTVNASVLCHVVRISKVRAGGHHDSMLTFSQTNYPAAVEYCMHAEQILKIRTCPHLHYSHITKLLKRLNNTSYMIYRYSLWDKHVAVIDLYLVPFLTLHLTLNKLKRHQRLGMPN